ncbi:MAG: hypothetical protein E7645_00920 [Ruminococcaceae bacterium]|nr:hypothetical protein [Oscillospiraceae bacterium]
MVKVKDMTLSQLKKRKTLYGLGSFGVSVVPAAAVILSRWELYTKDGGGIKLGVGGVLLSVTLLLGFLGRMKVPGRVIGVGFVFVAAYLLEAVLHDLTLLSGVVFGSVAADALWTGRMSKKVAKELELREAADRAGKATLEGVKEYLRQGGSNA